MTHVQMNSYRTLRSRQVGPQGLNTGLFDEAAHHRRCEDQRHVFETRPSIVQVGNGVARRYDHAFAVTQSYGQCHCRRPLIVHGHDSSNKWIAAEVRSQSGSSTVNSSRPRWSRSVGQAPRLVRTAPAAPPYYPNYQRLG